MRPAPAVPLAAALANLSNELAFIDLRDGDTLAVAQANVRVKGVGGAALSLLLNGAAVSETRIGSRLELPERKLAAVEYVGLALVPGPNRLELVQADPFGNERGRVSITVTAPGRPGKLVVTVPEGKHPADGQSRHAVLVEVLDDQGARVSARTPVTLNASAGQWAAADLDEVEPGLQLFVEGGRASISLVAPEAATRATIEAVSGLLEARAELVFVPYLRPLTGAGLLEAKLSLRGRQGGGWFKRPFDPFENELRAWATADTDGSAQLGSRAAMFFKGRVLGDWLLTMGYDSEKQGNERLLRDIQPDEFYPVYGDNSTKGYEAHSTGRLFARLDKGQSYLLYGDFTTRGTTPARSLGAYYRTLTGFQGHWQAGAVDLDVFASHDNARQVIQEFPARGTSGPFLLGLAPLRENSEQVEILVRDRDQPSRILATRPQVRFVDYELGPLTGRLIFRAPIPTLDADFNPLSIRVSYEVEQGGQQFWTYGMEGSLRLHRNLELGGTWVQDENPIDPTRLRSANLSWTIDPRTSLVAELAETRRAGLGVGQGARVEFKHRGPRFEAEAYAGSTDANFDNPTAMLNRGRRELGLKTAYLLDACTRLAFHALRTEDVTNSQKLDGLELSAERALNDRLLLNLGLRHA
ncbi:MAG: hypothetical protein HUU35_18680, partial [Armatimonadetes bacterium]|nr:hypothetical protein [Armatimonadota bacterium]